MHIIIILLTVLLFFSIFYCIKFAMIIIRVQETIEESLDIIDEKYGKISEILDIPIFYNSPEIKSVLNEIEDTKDSLLYIANQLSNNNIEEEEDFE